MDRAFSAPTARDGKQDRAPGAGGRAAGGPASVWDNRGLDWLNFFVANLQTAFGPFIAVYLTGEAWTQGQIGVALSIGTATAMVSQVPAGALVDLLRNKRGAASAAIVAIVASCLLLAAWPARLPVALAEVLHGFASCMLTPTIAALSLGVAGLATGALGVRLGRNARYAAIGNGVAAALMGVCGYLVSARAVFFLAAGLAIPGLAALRMIGTGAATRRFRAPGGGRLPVLALLRDRRLLGFAVCIACFHLANAAMLPLAAAEVTSHAGRIAEIIIAACIVVPQLVVALLSPRVGRAAERYGRRPVLLLGFAMLPLRGVLFMLTTDPYLLVAIEILDGLSGAVFGVMLPLVAADIAGESGRFNLCMGLLGLAIGAGATLSTTLAGLVADRSPDLGFLLLAGAGALATLLVGLLASETRPAYSSEAGSASAS